MDHLVLIGLALIQGFGPVSDDPELLRHYLSTFVVPSLVRDVDQWSIERGRQREPMG
ncbi:MAG: hypothetical protein R2704_09590 [Microthrixaceae bacterium]